MDDKPGQQVRLYKKPIQGPRKKTKQTKKENKIEILQEKVTSAIEEVKRQIGGEEETVQNLQVAGEVLKANNSCQCKCLPFMM